MISKEREVRRRGGDIRSLDKIQHNVLSATVTIPM